MIRRVVGVFVALLLALGSPGLGSPAKAAPGRLAPVAGLVPVGPERLVDTRSALGGLRGPLLGDYPFTFWVGGKAGVPDVGVGSVVLNVTVTGAKSAGYLTAYPAGESRPQASNLNFGAGQTVTNRVIVPLGQNGQVSVVSNAAPHVIVDVFGYFPRSYGAQGVVPARLLDTRSGAVPGPGSPRTVTVTGRGGVPASGVTAVALNVTAVSPRSAGYLQVWPNGTSRPATSSVNFGAKETTAGLVVAKVGTAGQIQLSTNVGSHLIVDILGWYGAGPAYTPVSPARVVDTRTGLGGHSGRIAAGGTATFTLAGVGGVPREHVRAVDVTLTATGSAAGGYLVAYASGTQRPPVSQVNLTTGRDRANSTTVTVGQDGRITLFASGPTDVVIDVAGYYLDRVTTTTAVTGISAGMNTCAVTDSGVAKCWGFNDASEVGDGTSLTALAPQQVVGLTGGVRQISASGQLTCAVLSTGAVKCWGPGDYGQIGDGTDQWAATPQPVLGLSAATKVAATGSGACALTSTGTVYCWGHSTTLGNGGIQNRNTPQLVTRLPRGVNALAAGERVVCAAAADGWVRCWGTNDFGLVNPNGSYGEYRVPMAIAGLPRDINQVAVGRSIACGRSAVDGSVYCWGPGILGDGSEGVPWQAHEPVRVKGLTAASSVAAADGAACAVRAGDVLCWGSNYQGLLGSGDLDVSLEPLAVPGLPSPAVSVAGTLDHMCAALQDGSTWCWGSNVHGALGDGSIRDSALPVEVAGPI